MYKDVIFIVKAHKKLSLLLAMEAEAAAKWSIKIKYMDEVNVVLKDVYVVNHSSFSMYL